MSLLGLMTDVIVTENQARILAFIFCMIILTGPYYALIVKSLMFWYTDVYFHALHALAAGQVF